MSETGLATRFVMAVTDESARRYRLYVEPQSTRGDVQRLATQVEQRLQALNIEYQAKRASAHLEPLLAFWLSAGTELAFRDSAVARGQREGSSKRSRSHIDQS